MNQSKFDREFPLVEKTTRLIGVAQFVALILTITLLLLGEIIFYWMAVFIAVVDILGIGLYGLFLNRQYFAQPQVQEKRKLVLENNELSRKISVVQKRIEQAIAKREKISEDERKQLNQREELHKKLLANYATKHQNIARDEQRELAMQLDILQDQYLRNGLESARISEAKIPGFGKVLKGSLARYGIQAASDIDYSKVVQVPKVGEKKALALMHWRQGVEAYLIATQPETLPEDQVAAISERYDAAREAVNTAEIEEITAFTKDNANIHEWAREAHFKNDLVETASREQATELDCATLLL